MNDLVGLLGERLGVFWATTGFNQMTFGHLAMIIVGLFFISLAQSD